MNWMCGYMMYSSAKQPPNPYARSQGHHALTKRLIVASYPTMDHKVIIQTIDKEIERLQRARSLLTRHTAPARKRGTMSAEGRERIAAAQRARWAEAKRGS